jgi:hypothetical protein
MNKIHTTFESFVNESLEVNEALKSSKLASILGLSSARKDIMKAVYNFTKVKLDEITDDQVVELHPAEAYKTKAHPNAIFFYISDNEKENPYADYGQSKYNGYGTVPGNTLLAIANGKNEMFAMDYTRGWNRSAPYEPKLKNAGKYGKEASSVGIDKQHSGYGASGLSNIKRISEVSDRVLMFDPSILPSAADQKASRSAAKAGATAFMTDKEFKQENINRYKIILATRAANDDIDGMVEKAIETVTGHIQSALKNKTAGRYESMIIGTDKKGREISMRDAANVISNILDMYQSYVRYTNDAKNPEGSKYYTREASTYAKSIKDKVKKVNDMDYAW